MRELGFTKMWEKLQKEETTTFRFPRKDSDRGRDWHQGERVKVVFHPRQKDRKPLGEAIIIKKELKTISDITLLEAVTDGFRGINEMFEWLMRAHNVKTLTALEGKPINKLTLHWEIRY